MSATYDPASLHRDALVIDTHNDSIIAHIRRRNRGLAGQSGPDRAKEAGAVAYLRQYTALDTPIQLDLPLMHQGGIDAAFFAVDTTRPRGNHLLYCMDALGYFLQEVDRHAADIAVALNAAAIERNRQEGRRSAVLAIENSDALEQSPHVLPLLYRLGVRSMTLTHSTRSAAGDGCEVVGGGGLTGFGRRLVAQMNDLGILIDVSHLNERGFWDVLEHSTGPVIATHSCCRALCDHPRNLDDEQLRALGQAGGVVSLTFVPFFIAAEPTLDDLLDHIQHAVAHAGIDHVGLGSDFDGGGDLLADATEYPSITAGLAARGMAAADLRRILGTNVLELLRRTIG